MPQTSRRTLIPEDFEVSARIMELAKENHWPDPHSEVNGFKDYHIAHGTLMANWEAAFRTWLRNCQKFNKAARPIAPPAPAPILKEKRREIPADEQRRRLAELTAGIGKKI
jgi:hypothetical protein